MPDYEQVRRLGSGFFGEVWLVVDRALGVQRAVKFVHPSKIRNPTEFYKEPQVLRRLAHPNIVKVEDAGRTPEGVLYIAMEYLPRGSVEDLGKGGIIPLRQAVAITRDACRGLEYAHGRGYVHRDVKPANILLANDGTAKLSDFGLATTVAPDGAASPVGYRSHLAPEVILLGRTSATTDVYATGVTLYRLVNGDSLLPGLELEEFNQAIIAGEYPNRRSYRPFVPRRLRTVINKAMNPNSKDRYQTAAEFRQALEAIPLHFDWELQTTDTGTTWKGTGNGTMVIAEVVRAELGRYSFTVRRTLGDGRPRRLVSDCRKGLPKAEIERHIQHVLGRLTLEGS